MAATACYLAGYITHGARSGFKFCRKLDVRDNGFCRKVLTCCAAVRQHLRAVLEMYITCGIICLVCGSKRERELAIHNLRSAYDVKSLRLRRRRDCRCPRCHSASRRSLDPTPTRAEPPQRIQDGAICSNSCRRLPTARQTGSGQPMARVRRRLILSEDRRKGSRPGCVAGNQTNSRRVLTALPFGCTREVAARSAPARILPGVTPQFKHGPNAMRGICISCGRSKRDPRHGHVLSRDEQCRGSIGDDNAKYSTAEAAW
jgi:hypothetical protein